MEQHPFETEITKLAEIQAKVLATIQGDQGLFNMGRQVMDNLNITYLLVSSLGSYMLQKEQMVDAEVEKGNVMTFPGGAADAPQEPEA
jgi:hypothetical protein